MYIACRVVELWDIHDISCVFHTMIVVGVEKVFYGFAT